MTSQPDWVHPPRIATWLVSLFTSAEQAESILGDLLEEYWHFASKSGLAFARSWYWRQSMKTVAYLIITAFRVRPLSTLAAIAGGFFFYRMVHSWPDKALSAITDKYLWYWSSHFHAYIWLLNGLKLAHIIGSMFVGSAVAFVAKGREMTATVTLTLVLFGMFGVAWVVAAASLPTRFAVDLLLWQAFGFFAILIGGAIVRTIRSLTITQSRPAHGVRD